MEFLKSLDPSGIPPHQLQLWYPNYPLIQLRPTRVVQQHQLIVVHMMPLFIEATITTGQVKGSNVFIPWIPPHSSQHVLQVSPNTVSLYLCLTLSISKAQEQIHACHGCHPQHACVSPLCPCDAHGQNGSAIRVPSYIFDVGGM